MPADGKLEWDNFDPGAAKEQLSQQEIDKLIVELGGTNTPSKPEKDVSVILAELNGTMLNLSKYMKTTAENSEAFNAIGAIGPTVANAVAQVNDRTKVVPTIGAKKKTVV